MVDERCADPTLARKVPSVDLHEDQRLRRLLAYARKMAAFGGPAHNLPPTSIGPRCKEDLTAAVCAVLLRTPRRAE
jgi:hypothetical protein